MNFIKLAAVTAATAAFAATGAIADDYPSKTIEVITHAGAGGGTDVNSRMMMLRSRRVLKADMVVVNKRGGNGALAMSYFKSRPADGYTIMTFTNGHALTMALGKSDLKVEDMRPIARGTNDPQVLMVNCKTSAYKNSDEFLAGVRATKLKFGTTNTAAWTTLPLICSPSARMPSSPISCRSRAVESWRHSWWLAPLT
jgi:putative tricarboxylic transport membrane protein